MFELEIQDVCHCRPHINVEIYKTASSLKEQELFYHLSLVMCVLLNHWFSVLSPEFSDVCVAQSLVFCVVFCPPLFAFLGFRAKARFNIYFFNS